ncbi:hypothetical protein AC579_2581 [Pseudocercospora musae]|uniref:Exonuclease domain-containing protein n=1 Tax=Pseudocercospora musae TaxID=113226 RepID=A0A139IEP4_9PEZI|nr:hypothetical protein AC579_2581 [Pseudocercospora musae]
MPATDSSPSGGMPGLPTIDDWHFIRKVNSRARCILPRLDLVIPGMPVFPDVEGSRLTLQLGDFSKGIGRVSVLVLWTDGRWHVVYDVFVYYAADVKQAPGFSRKSGVYAEDLLSENHAQPVHEVLANLYAIFNKSGVIVGHSIVNEQQYLRGLPWHKWQLFDTQLFSGFAKHAADSRNPIPSLKAIAAKEFDGWVIQNKQHDSTVDCRAGGEAFFKHQAEITAEQSTSEFQKRVLWIPKAGQRALWTQDATVKAAGKGLGALAWFPAPDAVTSEISTQVDVDANATNTRSATVFTTSTIDTAQQKQIEHHGETIDAGRAPGNVATDIFYKTDGIAPGSREVEIAMQDGLNGETSCKPTAKKGKGKAEVAAAETIGQLRTHGWYIEFVE